MRTSRGFTLIELLVVIAIIAILAAVLFPVLMRAKENGRKAACTGNMKQIYSAITMYASDNEGFMPWQHTPSSPNGDLSEQTYGFACLYSYSKKGNIFRCPNARLYGTSPIDVERRKLDVEPAYYVYRLDGFRFEASYRFWPQLYKISDNTPAKLDVNINDKKIALWGYTGAAPRCVELKGPLVDNLLHNWDDSKSQQGRTSGNSVLMLSIQGHVKFLPADKYPLY